MKRAIIAIAVVGVAAALGGGAYAKTIYMDADATGANNGTCWADAYVFLQDALTDADESEKPVEIRVAQGVYQPDRSAAEPNGTGDRRATFRLINGVTIQGGYAGIGQADPNARDIELYETVLRGDLDENDIDVNDPAFLLWEPTRGENSYHVVTGSGTDETGVLDGFTITAGNANGSSYPNNCAGGMYCNSDATVTNCTFSSNSADWRGAGMFCGPTWCCATYPTVTNCTFIGNSAGEEGGGMWVGDSDPKVTNCKISGNSSGSSGGGVMFGNDSFTSMVNCLINGNSADWGGGIYGVFCFDWTMTNCTVSGNSAGEWGGGMYNEYDCYMTLTNCIFWGNRDSGGEDESAQIDYEPGEAPAANYSCIHGWTGSLRGTGNIGADPCFVERGYWGDANDPNIIVEPNDPNAVWVDGDYHLKSPAGRYDPNEGGWTTDEVTSPCIDAGDPMTPIGLEPFPNGGIINMGAYGGSAEASKSWFGEPQCEVIVAGDVNGDCSINFSDFRLMAMHWLEEH